MRLMMTLMGSILLFLPAGGFGQVYFPLHVGDVWGYTDYSYICEGTSIISMVQSDTIVLGRWYANFGGPSVFSGPIVRADSFRVYEYDTTEQEEFILFDFTVGAGDTVSIRGTTITVSLGSLRFEVRDTTQPYASPIVYSLRDSIGVISVGHSPCLLEMTCGRIDGKDVCIRTSVEDSYTSTPTTIFLDQNYPNPFNSGTTIRFYLPTEAHVSLRIFNMIGQQLQSIQEGTYTSGWHEVAWYPGELPSGLYIYSLRTLGQLETRRLLFLK